MSESIAVRTPLTVASTFVVATSAPPAEPVAVAARYLHPGTAVPLRQTARELLAGPLLRGAVLPADVSPWRAGLLDAARTPGPRERLRAATHHVVLTAHTSPHAQPVQAQALRATARGLAFATDGVVHDPLTGTLIGPAARGDVEPAAFRLSDDWLATAIAPAQPPVPGTPPDGSDPAEPDRRVNVTTRGLARFGLPELLAADVRAGHLLVVVNLLRGVAVHLLAAHWAWLTAEGGPIRRIGTRPHIGAAEMYQYWGREGLNLWRGLHPAATPPRGDAVEAHLTLVPIPPTPAAQPPAASTPAVSPPTASPPGVARADGDPVRQSAAAAVPGRGGEVAADTEAVCIAVGPPGGGGAPAMAAWLRGHVEPIRPRTGPAGCGVTPGGAPHRPDGAASGDPGPPDGAAVVEPGLPAGAEAEAVRGQEVQKRKS